MPTLGRLTEPSLLFRYGQAIEDPRDGLSLFGPLDEGKPHGVRAGIIGTREAIRRFNAWVTRIQSPVTNDPPRRNRPPFPGFSAVFGIPWSPRPVREIEIDPAEIRRCVHLGDRHQRVYQTTDLFAERILMSHMNDEEKPDIWFVLVTDEIYRYCRPRGSVPAADRILLDGKTNVKDARRGVVEPFLFPEYRVAAVPYQYDPDFHHQLKARLLEKQILTQVVRESTIAYAEFLNVAGKPTRNLKVLESEIAWNICSAVFYKMGGRPWKLNGVRPGVCYIGLVFKSTGNAHDAREACCAAQLFMDSGDGVVFKGDVGPWFSPQKGDYHLSRIQSRSLVALALASYRERNKGQSPRELFIHARTRFNDEEWLGFRDAAGTESAVVGVRIQYSDDFRVYRPDRNPVLRGTTWIQDRKVGFLWTNGFVPRLQTYPGREVPRPLRVEISQGEADLSVVFGDILKLTKVNYNSCRYSDGLPVTLRFADAVGEILTCGPMKSPPPLPFRHYI